MYHKIGGKLRYWYDKAIEIKHMDATKAWKDYTVYTITTRALFSYTFVQCVPHALLAYLINHTVEFWMSRWHGNFKNLVTCVNLCAPIDSVPCSGIGTHALILVHAVKTLHAEREWNINSDFIPLHLGKSFRLFRLTLVNDTIIKDIPVRTSTTFSTIGILAALQNIHTDLDGWENGWKYNVSTILFYEHSYFFVSKETSNIP